MNRAPIPILLAVAALTVFALAFCPCPLPGAHPSSSLLARDGCANERCPP
jgi:hypothetical protein